MGRLRLPILAAIVLLALPAAASADHVQASVQVGAAFSGPVKKDGSRDVTVTASTSCTAGGDEVVNEAGIYLMEKPRNATRAPKSLDGRASYRDEAGRSETFTVKPGTRVYAEVRLECVVETNTEDHKASALARTTEVLFVPPRAIGWQRAGGRWCEHVGAPPFLQRGYAAKVLVFVSGSPISLLPDPGRRGWRDVRIRLRGAGVNRTVTPNARWWARGYFLFEVRARRAGKLKVSVVFDGDATNAIAVPVKRPPRGCRV